MSAPRPPRTPADPSPPPVRRSVPAWLAHPVGWRSAPTPWTAVLRGALSAGPLLVLGLLTGHPTPAVFAAFGAMLAGVNDRPGTRRTGAVHIGLPAAAGTLGMLCGALLADSGSRWAAVPALFVVGWVSGALSTAGPVWSGAAVQLLVATAVGAGMPLPAPVWLKAGAFLGGALWLLLLRVFLPTPRARGGTGREGEREAVADVFDALADALAAVGGPGPAAETARRRLTAAQQRADEALRLARLLRWPARWRTRDGVPVGADPLAQRSAAATALCEASIALLWEGRPLPRRVSEGPRRLARAVRGDTVPGALPSPAADSLQRGAFDRALLAAAVTFDRTAALRPAVPSTPPPGPHRPPGPGAPSAPSAPSPSAGALLHRPSPLLRSVLAPAGREYGLRVALCVSISAAVALALHEHHWYWLPATAAFLVKPDMGPLFSRGVNRFAGTVAGVLAFGVLAAALSGTWWPVVAVVAGGALIPVSTRHFGFQTAVITVLVLSFLYLVGDTEVALARLADTTMACGIALFVGHLPHLTNPRVRVGHRFAVALRSTERYLRHTLQAPARPGGPGAAQHAAAGAALRHAAYRALAEARATAETAVAELPGPGAQRHDWLAVLARAERIADAATVCAVRLEHGVARPSGADVTEVSAALSAMADALERGRGTSAPAPAPALPPGLTECRSLRDVMAQLHAMHGLIAGRREDPAPGATPGPPTGPSTGPTSEVPTATPV